MGKRANLAGLLALLMPVLLVLAGCSEPATTTGSERTNPVVASPVLLPTPTPASVADISVDPLRPPTPVVFPTPTAASDEVALTSDPNPDAPAGENNDSTPGGSAISKSVVLSPDLTPRERFDIGRTALAEGDYRRAVAGYRAATDEPAGLTEEEIAEAQLGLAIALLEEGAASEASSILEGLLDSSAVISGVETAGTSVAPVLAADLAAFHLARNRTVLGDPAGAIPLYTRYLDNNPEMAAYIGPLIADAHLALDNSAAAIAALEQAVEGPSQRFKAVENRMRLARFYMAQGNTSAAIAQYDAIHEIARTEATKGQMTFLAGQAELQAGNSEAGYQRFLFGVENYPRATETHQGLVALVNAGVPVDDYQRGLVNYYAGSYIPAIEAFRRHIAAEPETYRRDSRVFLAKAHEGLGDLENALTELEALVAIEPATATLERAELLSRAGDLPAAIEAYDAFLAAHREDERAEAAIWAAARLADRQGDATAAGRYLALADGFPFDPNTSRALFRAAELSDDEERLALWQRLGEQYPGNEYGAEALFRLLQSAENGELPTTELPALRSQIENLTPSNYFALRARDVAGGIAPFVAEGPMLLPQDEEADRRAAETWLRERLAGEGVDLPVGELARLSGPLADDPLRIVGEKLWQLGLFEAAKAELETVRERHGNDPLANYQMAVYFRDLGLFRSSIIAAAALLRQVEATIYDAPRFLGRLSFPVYYADLILPLAAQYGFDPRLQFALVRQESLFESFARSGAAAQGLSQVIPDTGAWIAQRLQWPDYKNEDLYKPYVGLHFGSYYLSEQLRGFDNQVHAALAAYNAGPGNAARWFQTAGNNLDQFVDTVNFPETRLYIERIYEGFNAYRYLYGQP